MFDLIIAFIRWLFSRDGATAMELEDFDDVMALDPMEVDYIDDLVIEPTKTTVSTNVLELPPKCQTHPQHRKIE